MARIGLTLDRKFRRLARALDDVQVGFGEILARGALELLWDAAYEAADDFVGDVVDVEAAAHWRGKDGVLCAAMEGAGGDGIAGFIEVGGSEWWPEGKPGTYRIHDLWDHAPDFVERRARRETEREAKGETLSDLRSAAGKKGRAKQLTGKCPTGDRQMNGGCPPLADPERATDGQKSSLSRPAPARPAPSRPGEALPVPSLGGEALPGEARPPAGDANEARASGRAGLGILGSEVVRHIEAGRNHALIPLSRQDDADALERAIALRGGVEPVLEFIARTLKNRDEPPRAVGWLLKIVSESMPLEALDA